MSTKVAEVPAHNLGTSFVVAGAVFAPVVMVAVSNKVPTQRGACE